MKREKDNRKKCLFYFLMVSISLFTIGLFALISGEEFQVNTYTDEAQDIPAIAMDEKGNFVITWQSDGQDGSSYGVFAQRFDSKGQPINVEFQVNTYTNSWQWHPAIAMDKKGNFVITWEGSGQDGSSTGIFAQRFNRKGKAIGKEFQVNTHTNSFQRWPAIAMDEKGNFVITWESLFQDGSTYGIFAQRFNKRGKAIGKEFQVNTYTKGDQMYAAIAMNEKGNFVITWSSYGQDGSSYGVFAQRFDSKGKAVRKEFQVNTYTNSSQRNSEIAMDKKGNFSITWQSLHQDGSTGGIFAQRFNKRGKAIGKEFQVNTYTDNDQYMPAIAMDEKGNFVITWESYGQDGSEYGIFAQRFNRKGQPIGEEFQVNTYTNNDQSYPEIAMDKKGNFFIITWSSDGQDGSAGGVFAKMFTEVNK